MADAVRVRIYDSRIQSMFEPGGDVWGFTRRVVRDAAWFAQGLAPVREGTLAGSHATAVTPVPGGCIGTLRNTAPHALFVILGTTGPIYPSRYPFLWVPRSKGSGQRVKRKFVQGQRANNFLDEAKRQALFVNDVI